MLKRMGETTDDEVRETTDDGPQTADGRLS